MDQNRLSFLQNVLQFTTHTTVPKNENETTPNGRELSPDVTLIFLIFN